MVSVRRSGGAAVAVRIDAAPVVLAPVVGAEAVEAALIAAVQLSWRLPGSTGVAARQWAGDGPWGLMLRETAAGDHDARGGDMEAPPPPREPLTVADMAAIERAARWLEWLAARPVRAGARGAAVADGALVAAVVRQKAAGQGRVDWNRVLRAMRLARGKGMLAQRYARALDWLAGEVARRARVDTNG